jgi:tetratricopeptide (TPR) repeat protein
MTKKKRPKSKPEGARNAAPPTTGKQPAARVITQAPAWPMWFLPALAVLVLAAYWNSLHIPFAFDDHRLVRFNFALRDLARWQDIFLSERYRPLLAWTFALNFGLSRQDPFSYHVFNIAFHLTAIVLFCLFVRRQTSSRLLPFVAAALMAVHPLNTESVSYVSGRSIVLCSVFYLSALVSLDSYLRSSKKMFAALYFLCFFLGAIVKEEAAMIPVMAFFYQWIFFDRSSLRRNLWLHVSGGLIVAAGGILRVVMQLKQGGVPPYPMSAWIPTEIGVWLRYLRLAFFPAGLNVDHSVEPLGFNHPFFWLSVLIAGGLCAYAWYARASRPFLAFWIIWYFVNLLPSSGFPLPDFMAEHRSYISVFGFSACAGYLLTDVCFPRIKSLSAVTVALALLIGAGAFATIERNRVWASEISLWQDCIRKAPEKVRPRVNLGGAYMRQGNFLAAIPVYEEAIARDPNSTLAYSGLGLCYLYGKNDLGLAEKYLRKSLDLGYNPDAAVGLGTVCYRTGRFAEAIRHFDLIYHERQESIQITAMMADACMKTGEYDRAVIFLNKGIQLDPKTPGWYFNLMDAYFRLERYDEAGQVYDSYAPIFVRSSGTRMRVAQMLGQMGRGADAARLLQQQ